MSKTTTNTFNSDLATAREVFTALNLKGLRPRAVGAFLAADNDDERLNAVYEHGAGMIRRGLRQIAARFDRKGETDTADIFWALRDDIDEETGDVFTVEAA